MFTFCMVYLGDNDKWKKGMPIEITKIKDIGYIKTIKKRQRRRQLGIDSRIVIKTKLLSIKRAATIF